MTSVRCCFDLYHGNQLKGGEQTLFQRAYDSGWVCLFHKLSQGSGFIDPEAALRLAAASSVAGVNGPMRLGGYHYMTLTSSVPSQVGCFMRARGAVNAPLALALDFEPSAASTQAEEMASEFVDALRMIFGHFPVLYTGRWSVAPVPMDNLPSCDLWLAEYGANPVPPWPNDAFKLHQYSDGMAGPDPADVPGVGLVDQSEFAGTLQDALFWWDSVATR